MRRKISLNPRFFQPQRWGKRHIDQFGLLNRSIIGLASILLFWMLHGFVREELFLSNWMFWVVVTSGLSFFFSITFGLWIAISRLREIEFSIKTPKKENDTDLEARKPEPEIAPETTISRIKKILLDADWSLLVFQCALFYLGFISFLGIVFLKFVSINESVGGNNILGKNAVAFTFHVGILLLLGIFVLIGLSFAIYHFARRKGKNDTVRDQVKPLMEKFEKLQLAKSADEELILVMKKRIASLERYIRNKEL